MANAKRRRRKNGNRAGRMCITCIVFVFAIVMSTQIIKVYQKDQEYIAKQADLVTAAFRRTGQTKRVRSIRDLYKITAVCRRCRQEQTGAAL